MYDNSCFTRAQRISTCDVDLCHVRTSSIWAADVEEDCNSNCGPGLPKGTRVYHVNSRTTLRVSTTSCIPVLLHIVTCNVLDGDSVHLKVRSSSKGNIRRCVRLQDKVLSCHPFFIFQSIRSVFCHQNARIHHLIGRGGAAGDLRLSSHELQCHWQLRRHDC